MQSLVLLRRLIIQQVLTDQSANRGKWGFPCPHNETRPEECIYRGLCEPSPGGCIELPANGQLPVNCSYACAEL